MTVALVTASVARGLDDDLPPLTAALERRGIPREVVEWDDPAVDWAGSASRWSGRSGTTRAGAAELLAWAEAVAASRSCSTRPRSCAGAATRATSPSSPWPASPSSPRPSPRPGRRWPGPRERSSSSRSSRPGRWTPTAIRPGAAADAEAHVSRLHADGRAAMAQPYLAAVEERGRDRDGPHRGRLQPRHPEGPDAGARPGGGGRPVRGGGDRARDRHGEPSARWPARRSRPCPAARRACSTPGWTSCPARTARRSSSSSSCSSPRCSWPTPRPPPTAWPPPSPRRLTSARG